MICFLCQGEIPDDAAQTHLCVKDNTELFKQRRRELNDAPSEKFTEYTDDLDFFDAVQIVGESE